MPKILSPKAWYLAGVGAVALAAEGARRLVRRRRSDGAAGYRAADVPVEVDVEVKEPPAKKPVARAAAQPKPTAEAEQKAAKALEAVADEAKAAKRKGAKAAKKVETEVEDAAKDAKAAAKKIVAEAQSAARNGKDAAEEIVSPAKEMVAAAAETRDAAEAVVAEVKTRAGAVEAAIMPDDLTQIKGIGPAFAKRLTEAGYTTYAEIANATPDALREATHAPAIANPDEWIAGARARI
ncbi:MAG: hypothetical protein K1X50_06690 [Candidatus Promineofilum sp.]|jgi:predicted flap endonuclease-1-like 5' DNA nuclease|nr:hypothetical protein [Promineifilum sp.]MCW5862563.1 hypothetical protein [Anaerolineae bacterium]